MRRTVVRRDEFFARWSGRCCYCDEPAEHIDHVTPISAGGIDAPSNLVPACSRCNYSKGALSLAEWATNF
ncbi:HNH endonuclease [Streptomyces chrestomyceticus]|uniref:HNH endonuclease n=1 Tax=Streptomyces chrestomyceticus TaxID=68185 RepID=UPI00379E362A